MLAEGGLAYIEADWRQPPTVIVRATAGRAAASPPVRSANELVEPQPVSFNATDGAMVSGELFTPIRPNGCGVIFVHGGIKRQMLLGFHYLDTYTHTYATNQYLASRGCAVLSVEYRSSMMYGYSFRNAPG